ncbi:MAG: hypothetical protein EHM58_01470 [Ignavibacteriae bacterium]|nr:MAG: hypothetical protein EHM58_01470 [Ignavibacteriota bacterium]
MSILKKVNIESDDSFSITVDDRTYIYFSRSKRGRRVHISSTPLEEIVKESIGYPIQDIHIAGDTLIIMGRHDITVTAENNNSKIEWFGPKYNP